MIYQDDHVLGTWMDRREVAVAYFKVAYYPGIFLVGLKKPTKPLSQESLHLGQDWKSRSEIVQLKPICPAPRCVFIYVYV
jgi:hypothetical protein